MSTNQEIRNLLDRARKYATRRGYSNDADDFAQEVYIASTKERSGNLNYLFIDYLRKHYGNTRSNIGLCKMFERHGTVSIDASITGEKDRNHGSIGRSVDPDPECEREDWRCRINVENYRGKKGLVRNKTVGIVYDLIFIYGFERNVVAEILGLTDGRISQLIKQIRNECEKARVLDSMRDIYQDHQEESILMVNWIMM